jgi:hypothetical protein
MHINGFDTRKANRYYKFCYKAEVSLPPNNDGSYRGGDDIYLHTNSTNHAWIWARMEREYKKREGITPILLNPKDLFLYSIWGQR